MDKISDIGNLIYGNPSAELRRLALPVIGRCDTVQSIRAMEQSNNNGYDAEIEYRPLGRSHIICRPLDQSGTITTRNGTD